MSGKRDEIIQAALSLYRGQSICRTTLKDVAEAASMPLGNLYYYFKSREALLLAVLDECERELQALLTRLDPLAPKAWLHAYFDWLVQDALDRQSLSCPFGSLASELRALGEPAVGRAAEIVGQYRAEVSARVMSLGGRDPDTVFLTVQGAHTVASILGDQALFRRSIDRLRSDTLA
ncbi:TetR/AcrR family transcriptional regulator [Deinococcus sp.]|uniref:TetR/AcrR family transcriptional regulator n=1 Tax=Deinococcus sp. TaxID=47478 RepID=UPI002869E287|nr:TetR/AcrR family transcriptional regulator [Deinococcus sp.]